MAELYNPSTVEATDHFYERAKERFGIIKPQALKWARNIMYHGNLVITTNSTFVDYNNARIILAPNHNVLVTCYTTSSKTEFERKYRHDEIGDMVIKDVQGSLQKMTIDRVRVQNQIISDLMVRINKLSIIHQRTTRSDYYIKQETQLSELEEKLEQALYYKRLQNKYIDSIM